MAEAMEKKTVDIVTPTDEADTEYVKEEEDTGEEAVVVEESRPAEETDVSTNAVPDTGAPKSAVKKKGGEKKHVKIDVSNLQTHYQIHSKSSLPPVLTEYGLVEKDQRTAPAAPPKPEKVKKKKKKQADMWNDDYDDEEKKKKQKEELFRQKYGDNRSTDQYYVEYLASLEEKVHKQRLRNQRQKEDEEEKEHRLLQEERQKRILRRRPERIVKLRRDTKFLRQLPKTDLARIVKLEAKLKREGKLKTQHDIDRFWDEIQQPEVFYSQFNVKKVQETSLPPRLSVAEGSILEASNSLSSLKLEKSDLPPRSLSHISERGEGSRQSHDAHRDSWAVTQQVRSQHSLHSTKSVSLQDAAKSTSSVLQAREAAMELEKRFPKLEMPKMSCFKMELGEKPPDPEEIKRKVALKWREKERKKHQRKLRKMHQLAMANAAVANRIIAEREDFTSILEGRDLREVRGFYVDPSDLAVFRDEYVDLEYLEPDDEQPYPDTFMTEAIVEDSEGSVSRTASRPSSHSSLSSMGSQDRLSSVKSKKDRKLSRERRIETLELAVPQEEVEPVPLAIGNILSTAKIMEAKCLSSNWVNYMSAGKSAVTS